MITIQKSGAQELFDHPVSFIFSLTQLDGERRRAACHKQAVTLVACQLHSSEYMNGWFCCMGEHFLLGLYFPFIPNKENAYIWSMC